MLGDFDGGRPFRPSDQAVADLIQRAEKHEGGTGFLLTGAHDAVAATFGVHAFVVDAARARLTGNGAGVVQADRVRR